MYDPPYLELLKPKYPTYDSLNFKLTGYDFCVLESYQKYIHKIAEALELDVSECWAHPPNKAKVVKYKPNSSVVESEYHMTTYIRYIQISELQAPIYTLFLRYIESALPEGVCLSVVHNTEKIEESRYVPDKNLLDLKTQLEEAGGPTSSRKKKN